jgi:C_GCAxxG_C_C family probable redox protein
MTTFWHLFLVKYSYIRYTIIFFQTGFIFNTGMKKYSRRRVLQWTAVSVGSVIIPGCDRGQTSKEMVKKEEKDLPETPPEDTDLNEVMSRESILVLLDQKVDMIMSQSHHCAQTAFLALREQFNLVDGEVLKALTPLPGLGEKGLACGALTGSLMALGLIFGRENIDDWDTYRASLVPAGELVDRFREIQGSTQCCDIVETEFGKKYDLLDPEDHAEYVKAGATEKCSKVVQRAVRIAADIILREKYGK